MAKFDPSQLNPQQKSAVTQIDGPVLILAGAGTGKTRTVTARIAFMCQQGIPAAQILAMTFTNKAANEMRERVAGMVGKSRGKELTVCTFHSLCVRMLRQDIESLGIGCKKNFAIYTASDQVGLVRKIIARLAGRDEKLEPQAALALISQARNRGVEVDDGADTLLAAVADAYRSELRTLNALDFDDLLVLAGDLLRDHPEVRKRWASRFHYVMVDEFQDTNRLQMDIVCYLCGEHRNICVVGDDDQSIYGWRGAELANILEFEKAFENPTVIRLEENYRSTTAILHTANSLIRHNMGRREKALWSRINGGDSIRLMTMPDDATEAEFVAGEIWDARTRGNRPWEDFAVLFRANAQSRPIEAALRELKIPYRVIGGQSFFDRREIRDLLAYLGAIASPEDDVALLRIANAPARGIGDKTLGLATETSIDLGCPVSEAMRHPAFTGLISQRAMRAISDLLDLLAKYREAFAGSGAERGDLLDRLVEEIGYREWLPRVCRKPEETLARTEGIAQLSESIRSYFKKKPRASLRTFLDDVALGAENDKDDDIENKSGVCLITLHASKGLEFPSVYLVGIEEGTLPHRRSVEEGTRDEERRLLYVGITRAQQQLCLTHCRYRVKWGEKMPCVRSSFIRELDMEHVEEIDYAEEMARPIAQENVGDMFAQMRAMLED
jgi:superfamily I DNA/RNA helicase